MIRTQVYLPESLYFEYQMMAKRQNVPAAQLIRKALSDCAKKKKKKTVGEALLDLAKHASFKGPGDLSTRHDDYLYGDAE